MSYASFLFLFIIIPGSLLYFFAKKKIPTEIHVMKLGILFLSVMAVGYTTPWDNYLVYKGIWTYGAERVWGVIGYVPIEEYLFFVAQTFMTGVFATLLYFYFISVSEKKYPSPWKKRLSGVAFYISLTILGFYFLKLSGHYLYMGLILSWACPILALQWGCGGEFLLEKWKVFITAVGLPTLYLWAADAYAIKNGIWTIAETYIVPFKIGWLPLEEATFFLVTNLMVVQGLILFFEWKRSRLFATSKR